MFEKQRTVFARYPYIPTRTSAEQFTTMYLAHCEERPRFVLRDLDRHVLAIDIRRFDPEAIADALEGVVLAESFWELEHQLHQLLLELIDLHGDPTRWAPMLHELPPLITTGDTDRHHKRQS